MPLLARKRQQFLETYGPWAVVTGASSGIGRACAVELARRGFSVLVSGRDAARLDNVAEDIRAIGVEARTVMLDMGEDGAAARLYEAAADLEAGLLVAAAGYGDTGPFLDADPAVLADMSRVNSEAVVLQSLLFGRCFALRGRGGLVLFGSLVGRQGTPFAAAYAATKGHIQLFGEGIAPELKSVGVDVVVSAPGPVSTGFGARAQLRMSDADMPDAVAIDTLNALGRRTVMTPGSKARRLNALLGMAPRALRSRILGDVMKNMAVRNVGA